MRISRTARFPKPHNLLLRLDVGAEERTHIWVHPALTVARSSRMEVPLDKGWCLATTKRNGSFSSSIPHPQGTVLAKIPLDSVLMSTAPIPPVLQALVPHTSLSTSSTTGKHKESEDEDSDELLPSPSSWDPIVDLAVTLLQYRALAERSSSSIRRHEKSGGVGEGEHFTSPSSSGPLCMITHDRLQLLRGMQSQVPHHLLLSSSSSTEHNTKTTLLSRLDAVLCRRPLVRACGGPAYFSPLSRRWALALAMSRAMYLPDLGRDTTLRRRRRRASTPNDKIGDAPEEENHESRNQQQEQQEQHCTSKVVGIVPVVHWANHSDTPNAKVVTFFDDDDASHSESPTAAPPSQPVLLLLSTEDIAEGSEITISYTHKHTQHNTKPPQGGKPHVSS